MIEDFNQIGTVTLGKLTEFEESKSMLTDRQLEVVTCALEEGYFEWPREISSEELADEQKSTERRRSNTSGKPSQSS